jgi:hypothetical protein
MPSQQPDQQAASMIAGHGRLKPSGNGYWWTSLRHTIDQRKPVSAGHLAAPNSIFPTVEKPAQLISFRFGPAEMIQELIAPIDRRAFQCPLDLFDFTYRPVQVCGDHANGHTTPACRD